jgi:damage-control phosphatase, subfamily I
MKIMPECYTCLSGLTEHEAGLASKDSDSKKTLVKEGMRVLDSRFHTEKIPIPIATEIHDVIKGLSGVADPYKDEKANEIMLAKGLFGKARRLYGDSFDDLLKLAVFGNSMDFFQPIEKIDKEQLLNQINFIKDDSSVLFEKLKKARRVLYLADNAGESFFDLPLVNFMRKYSSVAYVVKGYPVQNDITLGDVKLAGLEREMGEIIDTGMGTPGIILSLGSPGFLREYEKADLIFAKGMGHYESMSEFNDPGRIFCCLKAKCPPVANSIGVAIGSFVCMLM